ncbi:MAG: hypothetical protein JXA10_03540 [Anaerolineae bacterium]|nr:hypothetical protein [Anaerolineae bacterium]
MFHTRSRRTFPIFALLILMLILALVGSINLFCPALVAASGPTLTPTPPPTAPPFSLATLEAAIQALNPVWIAPANNAPLIIPTPAAPEQRILLAATAHFRFYSATSDFTRATIPDLAARTETMYADVVARLSGFTPEVGLTDPITVIMQTATGPIDAGCVVRGLAMYDSQQVIVFTDGPINEAYFWGVLAHETAHMIHGASLPGFSKHQPLTEGLATWGSEPYWVAWMNADSLDDLVRGYLASGEYLPLVENYGLTLAYADENCIYYRDILYSEWASFMGWLIREYGFGRYGALMESDPATLRIEDGFGRIAEIYAADFEGIYGQTLDQLEARWLAWLRGGNG